MSPHLLQRALFRQSLHLFHHRWKKSRLHQDQKRLCFPTRVSIATDLARSRRDTCAELPNVPRAEYDNLYHHQCFIQNPTKLEEQRMLLKSRKRKADGSQSSNTKDKLLVYRDSETMQDTPAFTCPATSNCDSLFHFEGTTWLHSRFHRLVEGTGTRFSTHCSSSQLARVRFLLDLGRTVLTMLSQRKLSTVIIIILIIITYFSLVWI